MPWSAATVVLTAIAADKGSAPLLRTRYFVKVVDENRLGGLVG